MNLTDDLMISLESANRSSFSSVVATSSSSSLWNIESISLEELLQNDWLSQNISQMFNISIDNLTNLLINSQQQQQQQQSNQRDAISLLSIVTIFYALIFVAGVLGNLITCIVISRNKFMHTATNFYLFNLAVSDLILLLSGMPQDLYNIWNPMSYPFTDIPCIIESVLSETAANATVLTITAFTVERYIAICHPFRQHTMSKLSRAIKFIFAIWVTAFILALPQAMQFSVVKQNGGKLCSMDNDFVVHVFAVSGFIFFCGPMTAICVLYVLIGVKLKRSRLLQAIPRRCYDVNRGISAQSRVIRMLIAVAVAFFLCWAPFHAQRLMAVYGSTSGVTSPLFEKIFHVLDYTSGVLYFLSTCINPLLYNIMSHKFRDAFKITLARQFGLTGKYQMTNHNYSALLRKNGSMRQHTSVNNNNAIEHYNSYRVVQLHCRDPSHHLSLQDSIRTTTTSGGTIAGSSCRAHRMRCISVGSQSTLMTSLGGSGSKNDYCSANSYAVTNSLSNNRDLQTQMSQMSSLDDANSLLESEGQYHVYQKHQYPSYHNRKTSASASYRLKDFRRSPVVAAVSSAKSPDDLSIDSIDWQDNNIGIGDARCLDDDNETELFTRPVAPMAPNPSANPLLPSSSMSVHQPIRMNSITELTIKPTNRGRHKLSRIIRRDHYSSSTSPRVELMRCQLPGVAMSQIRMPLSPTAIAAATTTSGKVRKSSLNRKKGKTFESLSEKLRWKGKRKVPPLRGNVSSSSNRKNNPTSTKSLASAIMELPSSVMMRPMPSSVEEEASSAVNGHSPILPSREVTNLK